MGNFCSKSSTHSGGHTLVPSTRVNQPSYGTGTSGRPNGAEARSAAAAAAENRRKAEQNRGVNAANPNQGRLAAKLEASKAGLSEQQEQPERIVWD
ncbi:hypothetical protein K439DRAFT_1401127 [Ramaria rubella]|nr:hypothetical protein K439DRAFT_1401127 [Ramaria rubella]